MECHKNRCQSKDVYRYQDIKGNIVESCVAHIPTGKYFVEGFVDKEKV